MQYLDNDMDDLFGKAGNDYPLRTDVPDFDAVLGRLDPVVNAAPKNSYRKYLLLLLLLPLEYLLVDNNMVGRNKIVDNKGTNKTSLNTTFNNTVINHNAAINPPAVSSLSEIPKPPFSKGGERSLESVKANYLFSTSNFSTIRINNSYPKPLISFPNLPTDSTSSNPIEKNEKKSRGKSIYIGVIAGPDLSTIKYQSIKNVGFSVGIMAGYKFNKKWSVETGFIFNNKKYYTDGKYFDKTKSGIPSNVYVESLNGSCNMFEVPVSVRYDFSTNKNRFFATLGATSYFMKKEKYTYDAFASGNYYEGHRSYDNSGNHLFSNMQFSIGYNRQLSNKVNVRIEPYIKVPVRDIGIGRMPLTSSGIYFSVMQSIK